MIKQIQTEEISYIQFSPEELEQLGFEENQKFTIEEDGGSIILKPYKTVEFDLAEFSREQLETLISMSCEQDISCNDLINNILEEFINGKT